MQLNQFTVEDALYRADLDPDGLRTDYSGRAMYGEQCMGIEVGDEADALRFMVALTEMLVDSDVNVMDIARKARTDSLGLGQIVYFPGVTVDYA